MAGRYRARRVDEDGIRSAAGEMLTGALNGANITMPHKRLAAGLADELGPRARRSGSVNTWVLLDNRLVGMSTDGDGIRFAWLNRQLPSVGPILVLGSGGAAAAAMIELEDREMFVSARRLEALEPMVQGLGVNPRIVPWGTPVEGAVVVNATPLGMHGEDLPDGVVEAGSGLLDMTYGPNPAPATVRASQLGLPHANGLDMLIGQAMSSFRLWTGVTADERAMRAALT